jgi:ribosomal-protein-alanine N-acetyltransferase
MSAGAGCITRLAPEDIEPVRAILELSGLSVDLDAELARAIALPWVLRAPGQSTPMAFLLAWSVVDELHLLDMATHPQHRRQGHSRTLLSALVALAQSERKRLILLEVRTSNTAAIALYQSAGFETTGVRRGYYSDTGEDALEMRITLDPNTGAIVREAP